MAPLVKKRRYRADYNAARRHRTNRKRFRLPQPGALRKRSRSRGETAYPISFRSARMTSRGILWASPHETSGHQRFHTRPQQTGMMTDNEWYDIDSFRYSLYFPMVWRKINVLFPMNLPAADWFSNILAFCLREAVPGSDRRPPFPPHPCGAYEGRGRVFTPFIWT